MAAVTTLQLVPPGDVVPGSRIEPAMQRAANTLNHCRYRTRGCLFAFADRANPIVTDAPGALFTFPAHIPDGIVALTMGVRAGVSGGGVITVNAGSGAGSGVVGALDDYSIGATAAPGDRVINIAWDGIGTLTLVGLWLTFSPVTPP